MTVSSIHASLRVLVPVFLAVVLSFTPSQAAMSLVWSDEFDGSSLDIANWTIDIGDGCPSLCGWGNAELEYYRAENIAVADGHLVITTRQQSYGGRSFTSGKVHTRNKHSFLYGRIEMRAKLPTGGGMWPAFWMMPQDATYGGWASSGEIDIMEAANATTSIGGTLHFGGTWPNNVSSGGSYSPGTNFSDAFHVYAIQWEPDVIRWYVDDVLYSTKYSWEWYSDGAPGNPRAPFDQDFYVILNAAVGGYYTGCTDPGCVTASFPQQYLVDYVRVYQETPNLAPEVAIVSPTEADHPDAGDIVISATASDADGSIDRVEFYEGTTYLGTDGSAPYSITWTSVPDGCYAIVAKAFDDAGAFASDAIEITVGAGCGQAPYFGSPFGLPALIQAEDFDVGGEGVAYHDANAGNNGSSYRLFDDVDVQACSDAGGGFNVGWISAGEWLEYTVDVPYTGEYAIDARVSSLSAGGAFHFEFDRVDETGPVAVPVTGGWQTWTTVSAAATLTAGVHVMRFVPTVVGFNLNYMDIRADWLADVPAGRTTDLVLQPSMPNPFQRQTTLRFDLPRRARVNLSVFDMTGRRIQRLIVDEDLEGGRHEVAWNGRSEAGHALAPGIYLGRLDAGGRIETTRLVLVK